MKLNEIIARATGRSGITLYGLSEDTELWYAWYRGKVKSVHNYTVYNGLKRINCTRNSLQMAKKVCEDWANLLINEKTDITLGDTKSQTALEKIFSDTDFWTKANIGEEITSALGNGAWVVDIEGLTVKDGVQQKDGRVNVKYCNALKMRPISIVDGVITECAFISESATADKREKLFRMEVHLKNAQGNYEIYGIYALGQNEKTLHFDTSKNITKFDTFSPIPWFVCRKPQLANNVDIDSPFGISVYANALDVLKTLDVIFDSYENEFLLGKKRLFVKTSRVQIDKRTGEVSSAFDNNDLAVYNLPDDDEDINRTIRDNTQQLRVAEHDAGLQKMLNLLSRAVGFGQERYKFDGGGIATASQVISENGDMFRNVRRQEIAVESALTQLVKAIAYVSNTFTQNDPINADSITVKFDDSIIEDKATERAQDRQDVAMGTMGKSEYRAKWYAEDDATAKAKIDEIKKEQPQMTNTGIYGLGLGDEL